MKADFIAEMLSKKAQYAIYALTHLARCYNQGPVLINDISKAEKIPKKFLELILLELKKNGFVSSKMGKGGGYYLINSPENINLADIVRLFDGAIALLPCATFRYYEPCKHCKDEAQCAIRFFIKQVRDETVNLLKNITLDKIVNKEKELFKEN